MAIGWALAALVLVVILLIVWPATPAAAEDPEPTPEPTPEPPEEPPISAISEDAILLAKIMALETRAGWPDWAVMCVGEVVLNRVASPLFPDTVRGVLYQTGPVQYAPVYAGGFEEFEPGPEYIDLALRLLAGERALNDPDVVWQSLFRQGSVVVATYYDRVLGTTTYFCA